MSNHVEGYAQAILAVAGAEGVTDQVSSELYSISQAVAGSEELRTKLADASIPAATRQQVVEDLLGAKASATTTACVSMVVGSGRGGDLGDIARAVADQAAAGAGKQIAEVRSAVPLNEDQQARLAAALKQATGSDVDIKVVIDESVMGGIVTQIGDTVIDGSVRNRLSKMREAFA